MSRLDLPGTWCGVYLGFSYQETTVTDILTLQTAILDWSLREPGGDRVEYFADSKVAMATSQRGERKKNEDRLVYIEVSQQASVNAPLTAVMVADGMGGMVDGQLAASIAVAAFSSYLALGQSYPGLKSLLIRAVMYANECIYREMKGMGGTTFSAILYGSQGAIGVNIGDSRIFRFDGKKIHKLTIDDTLAEHFRLHRGSPRDESDEPQDNRLAQFMGIGPDIDPHIVELLPFSHEEDAFYILTSDGAHFLAEENMQKVCRESPMSQIPGAIIEISALLGSTDNASALVSPKRLSPMSQAFGSPCLRILSPGREFFTLLGDGRLQLELDQKPGDPNHQVPLFNETPPAKGKRATTRGGKGKKVTKGKDEKPKQEDTRPLPGQSTPLLELLPKDGGKEGDDK